MSPRILLSEHDRSVNFVWSEDRNEEGERVLQIGRRSGQFEARYVRRRDDRFIVYLSVQTGCGLGCHMCHLTQTGQTRARDLNVKEVLMQAQAVLAWAASQMATERVPLADGVDFSFMARGDFFANRQLVEQADTLLIGLEAEALKHGLSARYKISTILPRSAKDVDLSRVFTRITPDIYYSLYSTDREWRRQWLPRALGVDAALEKLTAWQRESRKLVVLHSAFIAGGNDSRASIQAMGEAVARHGLRVDYNVVRYNPYSDLQGGETPHLEDCLTWLGEAFPRSQVKPIGRVGKDVFASCGMFVPG